MPTSTLRNVGGSVMMAIPKSMLEGLGLKVNEKVRIGIEGGRLVIEPQVKPRYSLAGLLAQCDPAASASDDVGDWDQAEPVGSETI
jgi:antitoxin ChpS